MATKPNLSEKVRNFLKSKPPLTPIIFRDVCSELGAVTLEDQRAIRTALQRHQVGHTVSKTQNTKTLYAIRLKENDAETDIYLTLPGIERDIFEFDSSPVEVDAIIAFFEAKYGENVVDVWLRSAQYRSVDVMPTVMARVRKTGVCRLCEIEGANHPKAGRLKASHIISRKAIFWRTLKDIFDKHQTIFSDDAAAEFWQTLADNPYHSGQQYIILLCGHHDKLLLNAIKDAYQLDRR